MASSHGEGAPPQNKDTILPFVFNFVQLQIAEHYITIWIVLIVGVVLYFWWPTIKSFIPKRAEQTFGKDSSKKERKERTEKWWHHQVWWLAVGKEERKKGVIKT